MDSKKALIDSIKNRALFYMNMYQVLSEEHGREEAIRLMQKATYKRGQAKAIKYKKKVNGGDLQALADSFLTGGASSLNVFGNEVVKVEPDFAVLRLNGCPLVEAWAEAGLSTDNIITMCDIAYQVDFGKFEGMGFHLAFNSRICEGSDNCELLVTKDKRPEEIFPAIQA
jgi:hypothetical protein